MSIENEVRQKQNRNSFVRLSDNSLRIPVEELVSEYRGRKWRIKNVKDMTEFACHHCAILSDDSYSVFAKFSETVNGLEQFELELSGLKLLSECAGVLIPAPIGIISVNGGTILVLESVQAVNRGPYQWRQIGQTLARIHKIKGKLFGLETHNYFGPLYQINTQMEDWPTFYVECRLRPGLKLAIDSGNLPPVVIRKIEKLISRLPRLCGPEIIPSLLHGDAQQNNFISTDTGAVAIDPAVYYGNPETDLAFIDYFQPVPEDVFDGYRDELPIETGFWERRDLWRVYGYLAAVTVEGHSYLKQLVEAVEKYL